MHGLAVGQGDDPQISRLRFAWPGDYTPKPHASVRLDFAGSDGR
jgi:hypothetical protein